MIEQNVPPQLAAVGEAHGKSGGALVAEGLAVTAAAAGVRPRIKA